MSYLSGGAGMILQEYPERHLHASLIYRDITPASHGSWLTLSGNSQAMT